MNKFLYYLLILLVTITGSIGCGSGGGGRTKIDAKHVALKIVTATAPAQKPGEPIQLSPAMLELFLPLDKLSDSKKCKTAHLVDVQLHYLVSNQEVSFKVSQEKKAGGDINVYKVAEKVAKAQLDTFTLPETFLKVDSSTPLMKRWETAFSNPKDSILVYFSNKPDSIMAYSWKGKSYPIITALEDVRTQMNQMICDKKQFSFVLLVDPPLSQTKTTTPIVKNGGVSVWVNRDSTEKLRKELAALIAEMRRAEARRAAETKRMLDSVNKVKNDRIVEQRIHDSINQVIRRDSIKNTQLIKRYEDAIRSGHKIQESHLIKTTTTN